MSKKIKNKKQKEKAGTYSTAKDETSGSSGSSKSWWEKIIGVLYPNGGGR